MEIKPQDYYAGFIHLLQISNILLDFVYTGNDKTWWDHTEAAQYQRGCRFGGYSDSAGPLSITRAHSYQLDPNGKTAIGGLTAVKVQVLSSTLANQTQIVYDWLTSGYGVEVTRHPSKLESPVRTRLPAPVS